MIADRHGHYRIPARTLLAAFFAVSLLIHIGVLFISLTGPTIQLGQDTLNEIVVHIQQTPNKKSSAEVTQYSPGTTPSLRSVPEREGANSHDAARALQVDPQQLSNLSEKRILGQVQQNLARYFYYPPQAQRRGIQGQVIIAFMLSRHGRIDSVSVRKSSGHTVLDDAALDAFQHASRSFVADSFSAPLYLTIPVKYQLSGG